MSAQPHKCMNCACPIGEDEPEIRVNNTRGHARGTHQFMHTDHNDCAEALRHIPYSGETARAISAVVRRGSTRWLSKSR